MKMDEEEVIILTDSSDNEEEEEEDDEVVLVGARITCDDGGGNKATTSQSRQQDSVHKTILPSSGSDAAVVKGTSDNRLSCNNDEIITISDEEEDEEGPDPLSMENIQNDVVEDPVIDHSTSPEKDLEQILDPETVVHMADENGVDPGNVALNSGDGNPSTPESAVDGNTEEEEEAGSFCTSAATTAAVDENDEMDDHDSNVSDNEEEETPTSSMKTELLKVIKNKMEELCDIIRKKIKCKKGEDKVHKQKRIDGFLERRGYTDLTEYLLAVDCVLDVLEVIKEKLESSITAIHAIKMGELGLFPILHQFEKTFKAQIEKPKKVKELKKKIASHLKKISRQIKDINDDDEGVDLSDERNSSYLIEGRLIKHFVKYDHFLCKEENVSLLVGRPVEKAIRIKDPETKQYPMVHEAVQAFVNKRGYNYTPTFEEILEVVKKLVPKEEAREIAESLCREIIRHKRKRRAEDAIQLRQQQWEQHDPADSDPELERKLLENQRNRVSVPNFISQFQSANEERSGIDISSDEEEEEEDESDPQLKGNIKNLITDCDGAKKAKLDEVGREPLLLEDEDNSSDDEPEEGQSSDEAISTKPDDEKEETKS